MLLCVVLGCLVWMPNWSLVCGWIRWCSVVRSVEAFSSLGLESSTVEMGRADEVGFSSHLLAPLVELLGVIPCDSSNMVVSWFRLTILGDLVEVYPIW